MNGRRYERQMNDPRAWPSNFGRYAADQTRQRVNELSWELAAEQLAKEIETVLQGGRQSGPAPRERRPRVGDPGE